MDTPLLTITNLCIAFDQPVLERVNLHILPGQCVGLVGQSGSGKSLLAKSVVGLLPHRARRSGQISMTGLDGNLLLQSETDRSAWRNKLIGYINQDAGSALNPALTCGRQMLEAVSVHHCGTPAEAVAIARNTWAQVGLDDPDAVWNAYPHMLSGGLKQRVLIAMAICHQPALLIADEPTTALDSLTQMEVVQTLHNLRLSMGMAMLFVSHDLNLVAHLADEVAVLHEGQIVEQGDSVISNPQHPFTQSMLAQYQRKGLPVKLTNDQIPLLSVRGLTVQYRTRSLPGWLKPRIFTAVRHIDFDIFAGETLGLVGASGSGKSSLAAALTQLVAHQTGQILFAGRPIEEIDRLPGGRSRLQMVFQNPLDALDPLQTVEELILAPMRLYKLYSSPSGRLQKAIELLEAVGLSADYLKRRPHQISGGQLQRVALARVLALKPQLIIFDESVSALDAHVRFTVVRLIKQLQQEFGFSGLFITHDLSLVSHVCHRVLVLKEGQLVESGPTEQIFARPQHPYTKQLLAAQPGNLF